MSPSFPRPLIVLTVTLAVLIGSPVLAEEVVLSAPEASARASAGKLTLIDLRTPEEWRETGVPSGAKPINMRNPNSPSALLQEVLRAVGGDRSQPLGLICRSGNRSTQARNFLEAKGFTNLVNVKEGMVEVKWDPDGSGADCRSPLARPVKPLLLALSVAIPILLPGIGAADETCGYPFPPAGLGVASYVKQLRALPKGGLAHEPGDAIHDLIEWTPTTCGDVPPDVSYNSFAIQRTAGGGTDCRSFRMGITPPDAPPDRIATPVSCTPSQDGNANGWYCIFR